MTISGHRCAAIPRPRNNSLRFAAPVALIVSSILGRVALGADILDKQVTLDITPQPLDSALLQFGKQTGVQVMLAANSIDNQLTPGVKGTLLASDALTRLLDDSGLSFKESGDSVIIFPTTRQQRRVASASRSDTASADSDATVSADSADSSTGDSGDGLSNDGKDRKPIQEVVVTGTHIAGASPPALVITIDRAQIDQSGYSDVGEVMRSLPQDYSGGQNPGVFGAYGSNNSSSTSSASSPNLRGLGPDSTLTLIDGHRFAYDGSINGVDLSLIPLAAVERIEVLTDGASAVYGSDAVAGVTNVILKNNYDGLETSARVGDSSQGGGFQQQYSVLGGHNWTSGDALVAYEYSMTDPLYAWQRSFSSTAAEPQSIYPELQRNSVFANAHQDLSDAATVFGQALYTSRSNNFAENSSVTTVYDRTGVKQYGFVGGTKLSLPHEWTLSVEGTYSQDKDSFYSTQIADKTRIVTVGDVHTTENDLWSAEANASGSVFNLPSGPVGAAVGAGFRSETYKNVQSVSASSNTDAGRHIHYAYGELEVPAIEPSKTRLGLERLDLNAASRYEDYNDFGAKTTSKVGFVYVPQSDFRLHGTWSQSFRAPELYDAYGPEQVYLIPAATTAATYGGQPGTSALLRYGSNPALTPETATSRTIGLDFSPTWHPTLKIDATYYNIDYRNRIVAPIANVVGVLKNPLYSAFIVRDPSAALQQGVVSAAGLFNTFGFPYNPAQVSALVSDDLQNATSQHIQGVDLTAQDNWSVGLGRLAVAGNASWLSIRQQTISTEPETALSGTIYNPPSFKARSSANWQVGPWGLTVTGNYLRGEWDTSTTPYTHVASWTTFDAQLAYSLPSSPGSRFSSGWQISVSALNLLDRDPPHVAYGDTAIKGLGYDSTNASPLGRFVSVYISKKW